MAVTLRLHPTHFESGMASPQPLEWDTAPGLQSERLAELTIEANSYLPDCQENLPENRSHVLRSSTCMVLRTDGVDDIFVPILGSEVGFATAEQTSVVALARPSGPVAKAWASEGDVDTSNYHVWLIVAEGGPAGLRAILRALGSRGAVRGGFDECFRTSEKPIASGASASVYKVEEVDTIARSPHTYAAKALRAGSTREAMTADQELALLCRVQGHPNVIRLHNTFVCPNWTAQEEQDEDNERSGELGAGASKSRLVLLMDFCNKGSLHHRVRCYGTYPEMEALEIVAGVLSALVHVHERGVVHRDVKAENVLLFGPDDQPLLTDFGIAALLSDEHAMTARCGTPGYAAPEMVTSGATYGKKVDVFSTGVFLFFLIFGCTPFSTAGARRTEIIDATVRCKVDFPGHRAVSQHLRPLMLILLTKCQEDRPTASGALSVVQLYQQMSSKLGNCGDESSDSHPCVLSVNSPQPQADSGSRRRAGPPAASRGVPAAPAPPAGASPGRRGRSFLSRFATGAAPSSGQVEHRPSNGQEGSASVLNRSIKRGLLGREDEAGRKTSQHEEAGRPSPGARGSGHALFDSVGIDEYVRSKQANTHDSIDVIGISSRSGSYRPSWFRRQGKVSPVDSERPSFGQRMTPSLPVLDRLTPMFLRRRRQAASV